MAQEGSHAKDDNTLRATELRLGLPNFDDFEQPTEKSSKRDRSNAGFGDSDQSIQPAAKAQVVGWPPVRLCMRNNLQALRSETKATGTYVKVSMDGAPYLRKIDLKAYKGYKQLKEGLEEMFRRYSSGDNSMTDYDYVITYEDKDGDLLLVGDVPWEMFVSSCKKLRMMKRNGELHAIHG